MLVVAGRTQNQEEEILGKWLMIQMNMISKLIMITLPNDQAQVFVKTTTITKETTTEFSKTVVLLEAPIVRNFTIKNEISLREF